MSKKVLVLTSSRADFGIYRPLLKRLKSDAEIQLELIVFGSHLYESHGMTINEIKNEGYTIAKEFYHPLHSDDAAGIASNMGQLIQMFAEYFKDKFEDQLFISLGDRFEMFAAVSSLIPFNARVAHLHGGETTLGAIDNTFRHAISLASKYHFCATETYAERLKSLLDDSSNVYNTGALSLDNLKEIKLYSKKEFETTFNLTLTDKTILCTFHPETVAIDKNKLFVTAFNSFCERHHDYHFLVGLSNADTNGNYLREEYIKLSDRLRNVEVFEHLGSKGYFSAISLCSVVFGNSSSGIIEVASFNKFVINVGDRQKGRVSSGNTYHVDINLEQMSTALEDIQDKGEYTGANVYQNMDNLSTSEMIHNIIKTEI